MPDGGIMARGDDEELTLIFNDLSSLCNFRNLTQHYLAFVLFEKRLQPGIQ